MNPELVAAGVLGALTVVGVLLAAILASKRRATVLAQSGALAELRLLNETFVKRLDYLNVIRYNWEERVKSKAQLERYDLNSLFFTRLADVEGDVRRRIATQASNARVFAQYANAYDNLRKSQVGRSATGNLKQIVFDRIENQLFLKQVLAPPVCAAQVRCTVRYTSPQGQNSYYRSRDWNIDQLRQGLAKMAQTREARSTVKFLRQQERNRMTANLRYQVLVRDASRCKRCGATAQTSGVSLHVDHIIPVSKGGLTELGNLQTLCQSCNLGKSDRH